MAFIHTIDGRQYRKMTDYDSNRDGYNFCEELLDLETGKIHYYDWAHNDVCPELLDGELINSHSFREIEFEEDMEIFNNLKKILKN